MAEDQRKVWLIAEFLADSFVGCSIFYDDEDQERVARSYRIVDETTGKLLHHVIVSRAFLEERRWTARDRGGRRSEDHGEAEIVPVLQSLAFLACLKIAGTRRVTVKSQMIEIEAGAWSSSPTAFVSKSTPVPLTSIQRRGSPAETVHPRQATRRNGHVSEAGAGARRVYMGAALDRRARHELRSGRLLLRLAEQPIYQRLANRTRVLQAVTDAPIDAAVHQRS